MEKQCNIVFEGGGVKGIGLVGAVSKLEESGYRFKGLAGTSAGSIVACLLAAGFNSSEMKEILKNTDYLKFKQEDFLDKFGYPGKCLSILCGYGIYSADYFEKWLSDILCTKRISVFGDIKNKHRSKGQKQYKFQAIASDITSKRILVLPEDLAKFGINPDEYSIAKAVRMSMSIPVFFEPYRLTDKSGKAHLIVDGGLLSNYPLWLFDNTRGSAETIGIRFKNCDDGICTIGDSCTVNSFIDYLKCIIDTMLDAHDKQHIKYSNGDYKRTIFISPTIKAGSGLKNIKATYFSITKKEADAMFQNGREAASKFLEPV